MSAPNNLPLSEKSANKQEPRSLDTPEMIDRLATELRAKSGGELPHAFYVEQVMKQLAGKPQQTAAANDEKSQQKSPEQTSVFHSWAISE